MANWCENRLVARGPAPGLDRLREAVAGIAEDGRPIALSLERIAPTPTQYLDGTARWDESEEYERLHERFSELFDDRKERRRFLEENPGFAMVITEQMADEEEPGESAQEKTWYAWRQQHWGTKWELSADDCRIEKQDSELLCTFYSAWDPPLTALSKLAARFPELEFELVYYEPDNGFAGHITWRDGLQERADRVDEGLHQFLADRWPEAAESFEN